MPIERQPMEQYLALLLLKSDILTGNTELQTTQ